jgi:RHS repeat-associated protein
MDGDSKMELMIVRDAQTKWYSFEVTGSEVKMKLTNTSGFPNEWQTFYTGDFNGDGKTDILAGPKPETGTFTDSWVIGYSNGKEFVGKTFLFDHIIRTGPMGDIDITDQLIIGDFNGDGKSDIYNQRYYHDWPSRRWTPHSHNLYTSIGASFFKQTQSSSFLSGGYLMDMNGDGKYEILAKRADSAFSFVYEFNTGHYSNQLEKILDGYNNLTEIKYLPLTHPNSNYTKGSSLQYPLQHITAPLYVVNKLKRGNGIGGKDSLEYFYNDLRIHKAGREMLGFRKFAVKDYTQGTISESEFEINNQFYLPYLKKQKTFLLSPYLQLSEDSSIYNFTSIGSLYRYKTELFKSWSIDKLSGVSQTKTYTYDNYGNVLKLHQLSSGAVENEMQLDSMLYIATGYSSIPNKVQNHFITKQRGTQPLFKDRFLYSYDANGRTTQVNHMHSFTSLTYWQRDRKEYGAYGNVTLNELSLPLRISGPVYATTRSIYDGKARFKTGAINVYGDTSFATYHKYWGVPLTETGVNGLTTRYMYDTRGELLSKKIPVGSLDSYTVSYSKVWDTSGSSLYYSLTQDPSTGEMKIWYDRLGREIKRNSRSFNGGWVQTLQSYNIKGYLLSSTTPHLASETPITTTNTYDELGRLITASNSLGTTSYTYNYSSGNLVSKVTKPDGKIMSTTTDFTGKTVSSSQGVPLTPSYLGRVDFKYDSYGREISAQVPYIMTNSKEYDAYGNLIRIIDGDAGTYEYSYDGEGKLLNSTDPNGKITTYEYTPEGQLFKKTLDGYEYLYTYFGKEYDYKLASESIHQLSSGRAVEDMYTYSKGLGLTSHTRMGNLVPGSFMFNKLFTYDNYGRELSTEYFNTGFKKRNHYNTYGYLEKVTTNFTGGGSSDRLLYQVLAMNGMGQVTLTLGCDGLVTGYGYTNGLLTRTTTGSGGSVQDFEMTYDYTNGNLLSRIDHRASLSENFLYDHGDRLLSSQANIFGAMPMAHAPLELTYDNYFYGSFGRILSKTGAGTKYGYGAPASKNALVYIETPDPVINRTQQEISYTPFFKASKIVDTIDGNQEASEILYDAAESRWYMKETTNGASGSEHWYFGDLEMHSAPGYPNMALHYIGGPNGLQTIVAQNRSTGDFHYFGVCTDHLGSITTVTDGDFGGLVIARQSYDAWGRERNPDTWSYDMTGAPAKPYWLYRGYTGHEMLPRHALINMNARMYDPLNSRMLRPDDYLTYPDNTQNYNRYTYALNNPLKFVDPDGNEPITAGIIIGAAVGAYMGGSMANNNFNPTKWDFSSGRTWTWMGAGALFGGFSGGLGASIAASGGPMANTLGIMGASYFNSVGTAFYTGGQTDVSVSFGVASYNFSKGSFGYLGKKGNSALENIGYGLGALANVSDVLAGFKPGNVELRTENDPNYYKTVDVNGNPIPQKDLIGHSQILDMKGNPMVDFGPAPGHSVSGFGDWVPGTNSYEGGLPIELSKMKWSAITIKGVNTGRISSWNPTGKYNLVFNSCVSQTSRALNVSGAFNIGIHPYILHAQMYLRSIGVRPMLFSHYLTR